MVKVLLSLKFIVTWFLINLVFLFLQGLLLNKNKMVSTVFFRSQAAFRKKWSLFNRIESIISDLFLKQAFCVSKLVFFEDTFSFVIKVYFFSLIPLRVSANELASFETLRFFETGRCNSKIRQVRIIEVHLESYLCLKKPLRLQLISITPSHSLVNSNIPAQLYSINIPGIPCFIDLCKSLIDTHNPNFNYAKGFSRAFAFFFERSMKHAQLIGCLNTLFPLVLASQEITNYPTNQLVGLRFQVKGRIGGFDRSKKQVLIYGSVPNKSNFKQLIIGFSKAVTPFGICGIQVCFCYSLV